MIKYRIETRQNKYLPWELFLDWTDWDTAYAAYLPEYERKNKEQWEGFVNIRIVREVNGVEEDFGLDNCVLYDGWIQSTRKKQAKRDAIVASVEGIRYYLESEGLSGLEKELQTILDNLEEVHGEDWEEKRLREAK